MQHPSPKGQDLSPPSPIVTLSHHLYHSYQPVDNYQHHNFDVVNFTNEDPPSLVLDGPADHITTTFPSSPPADPLPLLFQGHRPAPSPSSLSVGSIDFSSSSSISDNSKDLKSRSASPCFGSSGNSTGGFRQKLLRPFSRSKRRGSKKRLMMTLSSSNDGVRIEGDENHANAAFDYESLEDIHADELISTPTIPPLISRMTTMEISKTKVLATLEGKMYEVNLHGNVSGHEENHNHHHHNHNGHDHHHNHQSQDHNHNHPSHSSSSHDDDHDHHHQKASMSLSDSNHHCHDNSMDRAQAAQARQAMTKLVIGLILCFTFMLVELVGGWFSKSLAIFTDAAHLTSDLVSFLISLLAIYFGQRRPTRAMSFGYFRFEVLGVLLSVASIWVLTGVLLYFACHRIVYQEFEIESTSMLVVSSIGLAMNILMMLVLSGGLSSCARALAGFFCCGREGKEKTKVPSVAIQNRGHVQLGQTEEVVPTTPKDEVNGRSFDFEHGHGHSHTNGHSHSNSNSHGHSHAHSHSHSHGFGGHGHSHMNMNVRAALLHIVGDIIQSVGVLVAALVIHFWPHLKLADPICTLIFGVIVFATTYRIFADTLHILMEGFPRELPLQYEAVRGLLLERLKSLGVVGVHSLHVWALTHGRNALIVHLQVGRKNGNIEELNNTHFEAIRVAAERVIRAELSIAQTTIQVEYQQQLAEVASEGGEGCDTCFGPKS